MTELLQLLCLWRPRLRHEPSSNAARACRRFQRRIGSSLALAILAGLTLAEWRHDRPYNLLILSVESWRADSITPEVMPNLLHAAEQGRRFALHRSISAWTIPNMVTVLTGLSPFEQGIHSRGNSIDPDLDIPLKQLAGQGWMVRGLQSFMTVEGFANLGLTIEPGSQPLPWLAARALDRKPFVLWHHYLDTHLPYAPEGEFLPPWQELLPDAEARARVAAVMRQPSIPAGSIAFQPGDAAAIASLHTGTYRQFDSWFGALWGFLQTSHLAEDTIVVVVADHGDEHLERGLVGHASTHHQGHLHEEVVRVPLFIFLPPRHPEAARTRGVESAPTDHLLLMPSLMRLVRGEADLPGGLLSPDPARPWAAVTSISGFSGTADGIVAAITRNGRKITASSRDGGAQAFDLAVDPLERRPLPPSPDEAQAIDAALAAMAPPRKANAGSGPIVLEAPRWLHPAASGTIGLADLAPRARLEWTGRPDTAYVLEYEAGQGVMGFSGSVEITGTTKDFGAVDEAYWRKYLLPYGTIRLRIGADGRWSEWLELRLKP